MLKKEKSSTLFILRKPSVMRRRKLIFTTGLYFAPLRGRPNIENNKVKV